MEYYNKIKDILIKNETYKKVKDYSKNKSDLNSYFEVGRLLIEAQGGEKRAKYGNQLIKEYSEKLTKELGKGYTTTSLRKMRQFYLLFKNAPQRGAFLGNLSWSHYRLLLPLKTASAVGYYIYITQNQNLSVSELREKIKSKEYERIGYKEEIEKPKVNTLIKNPIIVKTKSILESVSEYALHNLILEDIDSFLKELGIGFTYIGHEYKIKIGSTYHYIDFLLFNYKFNCFVIVEIKVTKMKPEYIGQIQKYVNYIDENIKEMYNEKTIGIVICKEDNKLVMKYCTNPNIYITTYELKEVI